MFGLVNTGPVSPSTDLLMMYARYRLSTFSYRLCRYDRTELSQFGSTGTELTRFGSTGTEFGSVQAERSVSTLGSDRTETQVLEVLNANSNRTELDERAVQQFFRPVQS